MAPAILAPCTANALLITGHRRASTCKLDMVPPPGLLDGRVAPVVVVAVASERRAEGAVRLRNGHMARDW